MRILKLAVIALTVSSLVLTTGTFSDLTLEFVGSGRDATEVQR